MASSPRHVLSVCLTVFVALGLVAEAAPTEYLTSLRSAQAQVDRGNGGSTSDGECVHAKEICQLALEMVDHEHCKEDAASCCDLWEQYMHCREFIVHCDKDQTSETLRKLEEVLDLDLVTDIGTACTVPDAVDKDVPKHSGMSEMCRQELAKCESQLELNASGSCDEDTNGCCRKMSSMYDCLLLSMACNNIDMHFAFSEMAEYFYAPDGRGIHDMCGDFRLLAPEPNTKCALEMKSCVGDSMHSNFDADCEENPDNCCGTAERFHVCLHESSHCKHVEKQNMLRMFTFNTRLSNGMSIEELCGFAFDRDDEYYAAEEGHDGGDYYYNKVNVDHNCMNAIDNCFEALDAQYVECKDDLVKCCPTFKKIPECIVKKTSCTGDELVEIFKYMDESFESEYDTSLLDLCGFSASEYVDSDSGVPDNHKEHGEEHYREDYYREEYYGEEQHGEEDHGVEEDHSGEEHRGGEEHNGGTDRGEREPSDETVDNQDDSKKELSGGKNSSQLDESAPQPENGADSEDDDGADIESDVGNDGGSDVGNDGGNDVGNEETQTEKPTLSPSDAPSTSGDGCFPALATVTTDDGRVLRMDQIAVGDRVQSANGRFSTVFLWGHKDLQAIAEFIRLEGEAVAIELTAGHYLQVNGELMVAGSVSVGDVVRLADGTETAVVRVSRVLRKGLFNPHTLDGELTVDGVVASCYTSAIAPGLAHLLLTLPRIIYRAGYGNVLGSLLYDGAPKLAALLRWARQSFSSFA